MTQPDKLHQEVLSVDLEDRDDLYRIRRGRRVVYISILAPSIIPREDKTNSHEVISNLRKLPEWNQDWQTLTVAKLGEEMRCSKNEFLPHRLRESERLVSCDKYFDIADLRLVDRISDRVSLVLQDNKLSCLKIARFSHELTYLRQEIWAYSILIEHGFTGAPEFYGYVYEEQRDRVIGFVMEKLCGRHAGVADLQSCHTLVQQIHFAGLIHGDLNKYNFIVTKQGAKLVDFEASTAQGKNAQIQELESLADRLASTSREGCYRT